MLRCRFSVQCNALKQAEQCCLPHSSVDLKLWLIIIVYSAAKVPATISNTTEANKSNTGLQATGGSNRSLRPFMYCTAVSTSLSTVWGHQLLPKCIHAKACQLALPTHSKGQSVSGGAPVGGCKVRLVGGWPGWSFLTREHASQQDQTRCRMNHYLSQ